MIDNQATKVIKAYLTPQQVNLQLVKPHNHHVNAGECTIQTIKNWFIGALDTTNTNFSLQMWVKLALQVQDSINLLQRSRIRPNISAYETLEDLYDWNCYVMAPTGTKVSIYKEFNTRTLWAPQGLNTWLLGPSKDHYHCHLYYVPETSGYHVLGSADLFPQHCIAPPYSHMSNVNKLAKELQATFRKITKKQCSMQTIPTFIQHLD